MLTKTTTKVKVPQRPQTPKLQIINRHSEKTRNAMEWLAQNLLFIKTMILLSALFNKAKWIGLVVLGVGISLVGFGQVYEGSYTVISQAQIDTFNYVQITGSLNIRGSNLVNISGFETLEQINRELIIENNGQLETIGGFNNLAKTGWLNTDNIVFKNNPNLLEISGFENFDRTTGDIIIKDNDNLTTINGFENTKYVYEISIQNNQSLVSINFLENLEVVDDRIEIINNASLQNISEFDKLVRLDNTFIFKNNDGIINISGFNKINKLNRIINIEQNNNLEYISGFTNLSRLGVAGTDWDNHEIRYNPKLTNISGLANLQEITGKLLIRDNASLSNCCPIFCNDSLEVSAGYVINNNASTTEYSCNSEIEARNTCNEDEDCNFECQIFGCMDSTATNFDSSADCDDGSCIFDGVDTLCQTPTINNIDILNQESAVLNIF